MVPFSSGLSGHIFEGAFAQTPLLYAGVLSCWRGLLGIIMMTFGFVLAMYCKNIFVILTGPFMYSILENFILSILRLEKFRLVTAFDPTSVDSRAVSVLSFAAGPVLLLFVISLTALFFGKFKKNAVVTG